MTILVIFTCAHYDKHSSLKLYHLLYTPTFNVTLILVLWKNMLFEKKISITLTSLGRVTLRWNSPSIFATGS